MINNVIDIIIEYYPLLLKGLGITALLSLVTVLFGAIIGMIIALMRLSNNKYYLRRVADSCRYPNCDWSYRVSLRINLEVKNE